MHAGSNLARCLCTYACANMHMCKYAYVQICSCPGESLGTITAMLYKEKRIKFTHLSGAICIPRAFCECIQRCVSLDILNSDFSWCIRGCQEQHSVWTWWGCAVWVDAGLQGQRWRRLHWNGVLARCKPCEARSFNNLKWKNCCCRQCNAMLQWNSTAARLLCKEFRAGSINIVAMSAPKYSFQNILETHIVTRMQHMWCSALCSHSDPEAGAQRNRAGMPVQQRWCFQSLECEPPASYQV